MSDLSKIYLLRMTHILNIEHILKFGITHRTSTNSNPNFVAIGDNSLISTRNTKPLPNGSMLGDFIPFYFGIRTPMLYVIQKGYNGNQITNAEDIVYCITSVEQIIKHKLDFFFTNGHAVDSLSDIFQFSDIQDIETIVDFNATKVKIWKSDLDTDLKRRKEAEFLVRQDVPNTAIIGFAVFNQKAKETLKSLNIEESSIVIKQNYYF